MRIHETDITIIAVIGMENILKKMGMLELTDSEVIS